MRTLVDTNIWSLLLRRRLGPLAAEARELSELIRQGAAVLIGPVRQELLSGVRGWRQFEDLRQHLRGFPDLDLDTADYELAAEYDNRCQSRGIQGSDTDFLICAVAVRRGQTVFTTDQDFAAFAKIIPVRLHLPRE